MGQRLVIEIWDDKTRLANAYYHWSAFTLSSLELLRKVIDFLEKCHLKDNKLKAIKALEETGAGLTEPYETKKVKELYPNEYFNKCIDRNFGLLAITEEGMTQLFDYNEGFIKVNIADNTFDFDVCWVFNDPIVIDKDSSDEIMLEEDDYSLVKTTFNLNRILFEDLDAFNSLCVEINDIDKCALVTNDLGQSIYIRNIC